MQKMISASLSTGFRATEFLLDRYGPEQVRQVVQTNERIFRAFLNDGGVSECIVHEDGSMDIREMEAVC